MKLISLKTEPKRWFKHLALAGAMLALSACDSDTSDGGLDIKGDFTLLTSTQSATITEGDLNGVPVSVSINRSDEHNASVHLKVLGVDDQDTRRVTSRFTSKTLTVGANSTTVVMRLYIDDRPILPQTRTFIIRATDGKTIRTQPLTLNVEPTAAPDVYLLVGQSNMVGFSGDATRQAGLGGADEPNSRIRQLNVSKNEEADVFMQVSDFTSETANVVQPLMVTASDPLHIPQDPNNTGKDEEYIGLGLSFAKRAMLDTTADIVLVPAAWSGSSFCSNTSGPSGNWNAEPSSNPDLGNTLMYDRAVTRANIALRETQGVLRGILWHQGESDANDRCAALYLENMEKLIAGLRTDIQPDARGPEMRQANSPIPFVVGTMSRGADERGDLSDFLPAKQLIDDAHYALPSLVSYTGLSDHVDLIPANGYPCGNSSCIHFGASALREMGQRYYDAMLRALDTL